MNIIVLEAQEVGARLPRSDRRWEHVRKILRKGPGEVVAAGLVDGPLGQARILELDEAGLVFGFEPGPEAPPLAPLTLILGFPRPIQAARILKDLASLGIAEILLTSTELGEKSYAMSDMFRKRDFRRPLVEGAEQAGNPRLPRVTTHWSLARCLAALERSVSEESAGSASEALPGSASEALPGSASETLPGVEPSPRSRLALHPYGGSPLLGAMGDFETPLAIAIGSERGWTEAELALLDSAGFRRASLGGRILKTETAALAACSIALSRVGFM